MDTAIGELCHIIMALVHNFEFLGFDLSGSIVYVISIGTKHLDFLFLDVEMN